MLRVNQITLSDTTKTQIYDGTAETGIQIKAASVNVGNIFIGGSNVTDTECYPLAAGETVFIPIQEVNLLYALSANNGDKLHYLIPKIR